MGAWSVALALDLWGCQRDAVLDFARPGKSTDNGSIESIGGKLRAECVNTHRFMRLDDTW